MKWKDMPPYDGIIEQWKVALIAHRARMLGFRQHEIPDALQETVPVVCKFEYDPNHANGAQERTVLITVIDHHLHKLKRSAARYSAHVDRFGLNATEFSADEVKLGVMDITDAVADLDERQQVVCRGLAEGRSLTEIAGQLGCGWTTVQRIVHQVRERFVELGLHEWMCR